MDLDAVIRPEDVQRAYRQYLMKSDVERVMGVSHINIGSIDLPREGVEGVYPELWFMAVGDAIKLGSIGLKFGPELLEAGLAKLKSLSQSLLSRYRFFG